MYTLAPASISSLGKSFPGSNGDTANLFPDAVSISQLLILIGKVLWLLLLLTLFSLSLVVWLWVVFFRGGWRFWSWAYDRRDRPWKIVTGILYGFAVLAIAPFLLFLNWAQKQFKQLLPKWMQLPAQIPIRQLFDQRLGITLGNDFPFFIEKDVENPEQASLPRNME